MRQKYTTGQVEQMYANGQGPRPDGPSSSAVAAVITAVGGVAALVGYALLNTQMVLAYKGGTLANVHSICTSPLVAGTSRCASINGYYTIATVLLWGGLIAAAAGVVALLVQRSHN